MELHAQNHPCEIQDGVYQQEPVRDRAI